MTRSPRRLRGLQGALFALPHEHGSIDAHRDVLGEHVTGSGTISFAYGERLPVGLVKKVVKTRLAAATARRR